MLPPSWSVEDIGARFVVRDSNGQGLAYIYYEDEPNGARRLTASNLVNRVGFFCHADGLAAPN